jgi:hypothetical protein
MQALRRYALAGAALFNPIAAICWLDLSRGRRPSAGFVTLSVAGGVCAALAVPGNRPAHAVGVGILAATSAAVAGLVLKPYVAWLQRLDQQPDPHDARALLLPLAGASAAVAGAAMLLGRRPPAYAPFSGRAGDYRWIAATPTRGARATAWIGYLLHQLAVWGCIYVAQERRPAYGDGMRPLNWVALGVNAAGVALHLAQTRRFYDGLALDVPEGTALGSVAFVLIMIQALEAPRRGLILGLRRPALPSELTRFARRYHGYIFSWATIYTFWYHPMEPLPAHVGGLYHTLLLFVQSSLLFTRAHRDPRWTAALELMVLPHAVSTTLMKGSGYGSMFLSGFLGVAVLTQFQGLGLAPRTRVAMASAYLVGLIAWFGGRGELRRLHRALHIPLLEYGVLALLALLALAIRGLRRIGRA